MSTLVIGNHGRNRIRRLLRRIALVVFVVLVSVVLLYTAFRRWTLMTAPTDEGPPLPRTARVETVAGVPRVTVGQSWMERRDGIWRIHLAGGPRVMGHSHGVLAGRTTVALDRQVLRLLDQYVPGRLRRWLLDNVIRWRFRNIPEHIPPRLLVEMAAFSRSMVDSDEFPENPFQRLVYYHALHDMTQRLDGSPLLGCTGFAVWGKQTVDGHLLVGRNFDFEGGDIFDREKAVLSFAPDRGIPFVSVAWPGMLGVVTGVNARRLYVSINAARTDEPLEAGIPMALLVREILNRASNIKEALAVIKQHHVMVPDALLIADGKVPEAVVVELSSRRMAVRRGAAGSLAVTNHFLDAKFKSDASNDWLRRYTTSGARAARLRQLLHRFGGRIDVQTAAMILRNRTGLDDAPLGLGNRNAIDALIATHGVVVDLTDMVLWVSRGPHLLGEFVPVDLKPIFGLPMTHVEDAQPIAVDGLKGSDRLAQHRLAVEQLAHARLLARRGRRDEARDYANRAAALDPDLPDAARFLGDLAWDAGRTDEAREHYRKFLELQPPYLRDREAVKARLGD